MVRRQPTQPTAASSCINVIAPYTHPLPCRCLHPGVLRLLRLLVEVTFVAHLVACVWHALPMLEEEGHSWFETPGAQIHDDTSTRNRYLKALCKTTSTTALAYNPLLQQQPLPSWHSMRSDPARYFVGHRLGRCHYDVCRLWRHPRHHDC